MMKTKAKESYQIRNWNAYDAALKQRGSITFWVDEAVIKQWHNEQKTGRRGASNYYSETAIATMGTVQSLFRLAGRQTEGFLESLFVLMGIELEVPDHSILVTTVGQAERRPPRDSQAQRCACGCRFNGCKSLW
ncbi:MAG: hypothetical protein N4J56_008062 [Chroococcidiopsis sp. SAG 2025]|nr:hypothetical protein [Chroococcidiopsis sp. SAG 2025]MDV2998357.1 hypothetical protein [Chroococcidiopsis sp. SAG 2025]